MKNKTLFLQFLDESDIKYTVLDHAGSDLTWITIEEDQQHVEWNGYSGFAIQVVFDKDGKLKSIGAAE